jgi:hypothetical protein
MALLVVLVTVGPTDVALLGMLGTEGTLAEALVVMLATTTLLAEELAATVMVACGTTLDPRCQRRKRSATGMR